MSYPSNTSRCFVGCGPDAWIVASFGIRIDVAAELRTPPFPTATPVTAAAHVFRRFLRARCSDDINEPRDIDVDLARSSVPRA